MAIKMSQKSPVVYDGYVKYEEAEIHRSAIMQDFRNSEKKNNKKYILFYINGPVILHFLS